MGQKRERLLRTFRPDSDFVDNLHAIPIDKILSDIIYHNSIPLYGHKIFHTSSTVSKLICRNIQNAKKNEIEGVYLQVRHD